MTSNRKFEGYLVSIESKNVFYQGVINLIDANKAIIQLKNCFQNGLNLGNKLIDIKTDEIDNIEILADPINALNLLKPVSTANTTSSTNTTASNSTDVSIKNIKQSETTDHIVKECKPIKQTSPNLVSNNNPKRNSHQYQNGGNYNNNNNHYSSDENCFNSINDDSIKDDFDFEKNLALFDKNAFYEQMEGHSRPIVPVKSQTFSSEISSTSMNQSQPQLTKYHQISLDNLFSSVTKQQEQNQQQHSQNSNISINGSSSKNYRFDEMILDTGEPINYKQIQLPKNYVNPKTYVTDDGFVVPCIDYKLREQLFDESYKFGFNKQRQIECMGRCCTEMCLHLLGGSIRFLPKNNHQKPSILVLVNSNSIQGIYALCTARLLSTRSVKIYLLMNKMNEKEDPDFRNELNFFKSDYNQAATVILNSLNELNTIKSIDLILNGLETFDESSNLLYYKNKSQLWLNTVLKFIQQSKASVLSIDPPANKNSLVIQSKWCITPVLPMEMSANCGRVYLCDLGFTKQIFQSVNIKYQSPFGAKFVIPLHND